MAYDEQNLFCCRHQLWGFGGNNTGGNSHRNKFSVKALLNRHQVGNAQGTCVPICVKTPRTQSLKARFQLGLWQKWRQWQFAPGFKMANSAATAEGSAAALLAMFAIFDARTSLSLVKFICLIHKLNFLVEGRGMPRPTDGFMDRH